jgi:hypothetical protein
VAIDYTKIPSDLEQKFAKFNENNALRPTIINPGNTWTKTVHKYLLSEPETTSLDTEVQERKEEGEGEKELKSWGKRSETGGWRWWGEGRLLLTFITGTKVGEKQGI